MPMRMPFVGGNWKMNTDLASACELADDVKAMCAELAQSVDIALFPPFPYLLPVGKTLGHEAILLGAQDVWHEPNGAYTGEVSTEMLNDLRVMCVLTGHSERRHVIGEDDELVNLKTRAALDDGLWVVLCIGETLDQREAGRTDEVNLHQLRAGLDGVPPEQFRQIVIAYEPVWAIGTGKTATPADAQAAHAVIRADLRAVYGDEIADSMRIIYGGSVKASNAAGLFSQPDIDGGLIGGASLAAEDFAAIVRAAGAARA